MPALEWWSRSLTPCSHCTFTQLAASCPLTGPVEIHTQATLVGAAFFSLPLLLHLANPLNECSGCTTVSSSFCRDLRTVTDHVHR